MPPEAPDPALILNADSVAVPLHGDDSLPPLSTDLARPVTRDSRRRTYGQSMIAGAEDWPRSAACDARSLHLCLRQALARLGSSRLVLPAFGSAQSRLSTPLAFVRRATRPAPGGTCHGTVHASQPSVLCQTPLRSRPLRFWRGVLSL